MKRLVVIGSIVAIVVLLIALLFRHSQRPTQEFLTGNWMQQDSLGALVLRPGGKYHWRIYSQKIQHDAIPEGASQWLYAGTWDVKDGALVLSILSADARNTTNVEAVGTIDKFRAIKVNEKQLALEKDGVTIGFHR